MDTRLNGTVTALRIAIGLMATLAGLGYPVLAGNPSSGG